MEKSINYLIMIVHSLMKSLIWVPNCPTMTHLLMMPPLVCFSISIYYPPNTQYPYYPQDTQLYFPFFVPTFDPHFQSCASTASAETSMYLSSSWTTFTLCSSSKIIHFFKDFRRRKIITLCKLPVIPQKNCGKVLTSAENCMAIEEKEKNKLE